MRAARRKQVAKGDLLVGAVILVLAAALFFLLFSGSAQALTAQVALDGEIVYSCRLDELDEPMQFQVEGAEYPLILEFSRDGVRVLETTCPGEDCQHMGTIRTQERQIICLPNRLIVTLNGDNPSYDAMTG